MNCLISADKKNSRADLVVIPVCQHTPPEQIFSMYPGLKSVFKKQKIKGRVSESVSFFSEKSGTWFLIAGAGPVENLAAIRKFSRNVVTKIKDLKIARVRIDFRQKISFSDLYIKNLIDYLYLNAYHFSGYKNKKQFFLKRICLQFNDNFDSGSLNKLLTRCQTIAANCNLARDAISEIPSRMNPQCLIDLFRDAAARSGLGFACWRKKELEAKNLFGTIHVARGSAYEPAIVRIEYSPPAPQKTVCLIGKGVTFDSGGLNLKSAGQMLDMKSDMAGSVTILSVIISAAEMNLPLRLIGFSPIAENMPGNCAYKPGDIIVYPNKKTVEVVNTDAEGRLALADAILLACAEKPDLMIEFSTLTGAIVTSLGDMIAGLMTRNTQLGVDLIQAGEQTGEHLWNLPLFDEYRESIKSKIADLKNADYQGGSSIKAALFLEEFAAKVPFAHIDIAGTAFINKANPFYGLNGATGFGVRLMMQFFGNRVK